MYYFHCTFIIIHTNYTSHSSKKLHLLLHDKFAHSFHRLFIAGWLPSVTCVRYKNYLWCTLVMAGRIRNRCWNVPSILTRPSGEIFWVINGSSMVLRGTYWNLFPILCRSLSCVIFIGIMRNNTKNYTLRRDSDRLLGVSRKDIEMPRT
jgi:hypothetical protein